MIIMLRVKEKVICVYEIGIPFYALVEL